MCSNSISWFKVVLARLTLWYLHVIETSGFHLRTTSTHEIQGLVTEQASRRWRGKLRQAIHFLSCLIKGRFMVMNKQDAYRLSPPRGFHFFPWSHTKSPVSNAC